MIIPAIRNMKDLEKFVKTKYDVCFILDIHIGHLTHFLDLVKLHQKRAYIHVDLIKGLSTDEAACEYLIQKYKPEGIVTTKPKLIKKAKRLNVKTVLRTFIIDSNAYEKSKIFIAQSEPDFVEMLPGIAYKVVERLNEEHHNIIAGGLIETEQEVNDAIKAGAKFVTTSNTSLWQSFEVKK